MFLKARITWQLICWINQLYGEMILSVTCCFGTVLTTLDEIKRKMGGDVLKMDMTSSNFVLTEFRRIIKLLLMMPLT